MTIFRFKPLEMPQKPRNIVSLAQLRDEVLMKEALADPTGKKAAQLLARKLEQHAKIMGLI
jgi:hypothetical protein